MIERIRTKNENFKELKLKLKQSTRQSFIELDNILSNVQDKKAFIFLMDSHSTEKEITREILEGLLENIIEMNSDYIEFIKIVESNKDGSSVAEIIYNVFSPKNAKTLIIVAITLGLVLSVAFNENVAIKIIDVVTPSGLNKDVK